MGEEEQPMAKKIRNLLGTLAAEMPVRKKAVALMMMVTTMVARVVERTEEEEAGATEEGEVKVAAGVDISILHSKVL